MLHFLPFLANLSLSEFKLDWPSSSQSVPCDTSLASTANFSSFSTEQLSLTLAHEIDSGIIATRTLDTTSRCDLRAFVRRAQLTTSPGSSLLIGFSSLSAPLSFSSRSYLLAAVPFLPCDPSSTGIKNLDDGSHKRPSACRTLLPVQITLAQVLRELTSGPSPLTVQHVQNVTAEYATYLDDYVQDLEENDRIRRRFVAKWGLDAWREERLLVTWESALFRAGLLTRWIVLARG